ncbi:O-succinylhomoserine sulfhydrylase [Kingella kingae]|uniref:O-succinylhomoserine sulfhydrylase n=2 Tax=Kingella kingae TaxID=504 RepID=F5S542_KINKI|nr:O-succinylhomoserine sulfhydrylase [Kingella kingae]EGK11467.1 O-succinylhomoserine sulfhydrylase [Kingella kingae ATCC 23330]EIC14340.1 O-succinylhomoserine sulfhydrolase [Kingella kingae PYKK081]MBD3613901.1 O-succinylhomoserine sulfhydrylase [Kingella kingae]MBD3632152.1 O-succinylhomoserine sulfhydrylase [Kingella kingae]MBD3659532.1 O-succinylhomoserine sulfhydrylase [Kingella kingae]
MKNLHPQTLAIRASKEQTPFNEHQQALFLTSSFMAASAADAAALFAKTKDGYTYSRTANPTIAAFQQRIAALEGAEAGIATATGMAAIQAAMLTFLSAGDHMISSRSLFGTTAGFITGHLMRFGIEVTFVSQTDISEWEKAIRPNTKMLFLETPSNPLNEVADLEKLAALAQQHGALLAVDNCFCSPAVQQPLRWGADLTIQSATKFIDGHGRALGGIVCGKADLIKQIALYVNSAGLSLSPFNAWLLLSGSETIFVRTQQQAANAEKVATWLRSQPNVNAVYYAGLPDHAQADLVQKQQSSGGMVIAFEVAGGVQAAWNVIDSVEIFSKTANFGDVRSTITHPWTTTHGRMSPENKLAAGISEGLIRISVGLEYADDLIADLEQALAASQK